MGLSEALTFTLREEGGFVHHPQDPGGATNKGITQAVYNAFRDRTDQPRQSVRQIRDDEVFEIYEQGYWRDSSCPEINEIDSRIALAHFDFAVHSGIRRAAIVLQRVLGVGDDGIIGPITLGALKKSDLTKTLQNYIDEREEFLWSLVVGRPSTYLPFLRGWCLRIRRLRGEVGLRC